MPLQANYVHRLGLAGAFIWSVELDDFAGICKQGKYPLLSTIARIFRSNEDRNEDHFESDSSRYADYRKSHRDNRRYGNAMTESPPRTSIQRSSAVRGRSHFDDNGGLSQNSDKYERSSDYAERYQHREDTPRRGDRFKVARSDGYPRIAAPDREDSRRSDNDDGYTSFRSHRPNIKSEAATTRRVSSSR